MVTTIGLEALRGLLFNNREAQKAPLTEAVRHGRYSQPKVRFGHKSPAGHRASGAMDNASAYGAEDSRFDS